MLFKLGTNLECEMRVFGNQLNLKKIIKIMKNK